jgi:hypothetical protein
VAELADLDTDIRAPGGVMTEELCGSIDHQPPCPLAPHFTSAERTRDELVIVRVLFACEAFDEGVVRARVDEALARSWDLVSSRPDVVHYDEADHAGRLVGS